MTRVHLLWVLLPALLLSPLFLVACQREKQRADLREGLSFAELRTIKGSVLVSAPGKSARRPYPRERLIDDETIDVRDGGLVWMRRDGGATWLVSGPAKLKFKAEVVELNTGRAFIDSERGDPVSLLTPQGQLELSSARASVEIGAKGTSVYVLRGSARADGAGRATTGERLTLLGKGKVDRAPVLTWDDWTGGLGTADPAADAAPFGIGTVGARPPGNQGQPRFSLVIQRMDVNVTIDRDFAVTEVDQTFVNPSSDVVEGIFSFRTPARAVLQRFGVDREGEVVWGRVKEMQAATRQYESNVYAGSEEDPALLTWRAAGTYNARLYPIKAGAKRRVVTRYSEWLSRQGPRGERRLYVYPMAAEGALASLPRIEELTVKFDLSRAGAQSIRSGMGGKREGDKVIVKAFDFVPRADLAIELFDDGQPAAQGYRAPHGMTADDAPEELDADFARKVSREEKDYVAIPLSAPYSESDAGDVDLAIVVDTSAATEPSALAIARSVASSLLTHLGPNDRAALWTGDASLKPVAPGAGKLSRVDDATRRRWLSGLAAVERGGATDLGTLLSEAAATLDPKRRGTVVYIGDGAPSVGELAPNSLRERVARLPKTTRVLVAAVGSQANLALLESLTRGAPAEHVHDAYGAARASLRLLEAAGRPLWLGAELELGPSVERILPKQLPPISADETVLVVGRLTGVQPTKLKLTGSEGVSERPLAIRALADAGDLRRRWGEARLAELMESGAGRASLVDLGLRFGLVSPLTALYVPTKREAASEPELDPAMLAQQQRNREKRWRPWGSGEAYGSLSKAAAPLASSAPEELTMAEEDNKEGGTGTRAKGEEGSMGNPGAPSKQRYAVAGPNDNDPHIARQQALRESEEFGMIGLLNSGAAGDPAAAAPRDEPLLDAKKPAPELEAAEKTAAPRSDVVGRPASKRAQGSPFDAPDAMSATGNMWGDEIGEAAGGGGLGLSGVGSGGGGSPAPTGLGSIGSTGRGAGQGFGAGHGRLGGAHSTRAPQVRLGATTVTGRLPHEVVRRIVRQNFGRFRLCYEQGLAKNANLEGRVSTRFVIGRDGSVSNVANVGSDLPDSGVVGCVQSAFYGLTFPQPEGGIVTVVYPIMFSPGDAGPAAPPAGPTIRTATGPIATIGHEPRPCGAGADLPLEERKLLWQERWAASSKQSLGLTLYVNAVAHCEASTWRERAALLTLIVGGLDSIQDRVGLWKLLLTISPTAADTVFRLMLLRVQTSADLRALHDALGFERIQPELLAALLKKGETPSDRLRLLRGAAERFPEDTELALTVLEAYEDVGDDAGGRAWARKLRRRPDATSHLRTSVAEYYFRLAAKQKGPAAERDAEEARRTFGEIVEFAPEDPLARRRLGDLLRAHGLYAEAMRQYQTLAELTPDDPAVPLLLAAAAQGTGKTEEAVRWLEKAAGTAAPDGGSSVALAARGLASAFLAWARESSLAAGKKDEVERLRTRAARLASMSSGEGVRVIVTWSHPELRTALWTNSLGSLMPAPDNLPLLGVAQAFVPASPSPLLELRADPEDAARAARLGLTAVVTVIVAEGSDGERLLHREVSFRGSDGKARERVRLRFENNQLAQEEVL